MRLIILTSDMKRKSTVFKGLLPLIVALPFIVYLIVCLLAGMDLSCWDWQGSVSYLTNPFVIVLLVLSESLVCLLAYLYVTRHSGVRWFDADRWTPDNVGRKCGNGLGWYLCKVYHADRRQFDYLLLSWNGAWRTLNGEELSDYMEVLHWLTDYPDDSRKIDDILPG